MTHPISMIPYANVAPFRLLGLPPGCDFVSLTPSQSVDALARGEVVAACVPVGALPQLGDRITPLLTYGIAAGREVGSVMLFSKRPLEKLAAPARVFLTEQSATSVRLLYLLLGKALGFERLPFQTADPDRADAVLLIGDDALQRAQRRDDAYRYDLVTLWYRQFALPFVFARWVARRDIGAELRAELEAWLGGLDADEGRLIERAAAIEGGRLGIPTAAMARYLRGMDRRITAEGIEGQARFLHELRCCGDAQFPMPDATVGQSGVYRLGREEALALLKTAPLGELMARAHRIRQTRHPEGVVTYVMDTNPNYTNVCVTGCRFCAFCRDEGDDEAYTLSPEALGEKVAAAAEKGATTVLLQGGHNPKVTLDRWLAYIRAIRDAAPQIQIHPFSAPEVLFTAQNEGRTIDEVLLALRDCGIDTLPGGGAEILTDSVRRVIAPQKCTATQWFEVMERAHLLGFKTTATMMYGHLERDEDIVDHLLALRALQDRSFGFSSFIPWSFKPGHSPLTEVVPQAAHPARYVRLVALSRLVLDNFEHIQSSWFSETQNAGVLGLLAGADDFGGVLVEENVLKTSGYVKQTTAAKVRRLIRDAGFIPARRDSHYTVLERFDDEPQS